MRTYLILLALVLAACSSDSGPLANRHAIDATAPGEVPDTATTAAPVPIDAVPADQLGQLTGELRCSFADAAGRTLLVGSANVGRSESVDALIGNGARAVAVRREVGGGFAALQRGGGFAGGGNRVTVTVGEPATTGGEGSVRRATLTLVPTGEPPRTVAGRWRCGP